MKQKQDKESLDSNGKWHGYQEWYNIYGQLRLRVLMKHGAEIGYEEYHGTKSTSFYIK